MRRTQLLRFALRSAAAATLATLLAPGPAAAGSAPAMHLKVRNGTAQPVTVRLLHADGRLQNQETVAAGGTRRFTFEWCPSCCGTDKEQRFEVSTGSTLRATGELYMSTRRIVTGPDGGTVCDGNNQMTVKDADETDAWIVSTGYENRHRTAVLTVTTAS